MALIPKIRNKSGYLYIRIKGRDYYLGKDPKEAKAKARSLLIEHYLDKPGKSSKADYRIRHVFALYLRFIEGTIADSSFKNLRLMFRKTVRLTNNIAVVSFTADSFSSFMEELAREGMCKQTIKGYRNSIVAAFKYAQTRNVLDANKATELSFVKIPRCAKPSKKVKPAKREVFEAVLEKLPTVCQDILRLELLTGMRPAELLALRKKHLTAIEGGMYKYEIWEHKTVRRTGEPLVKYIGHQAVQILNCYLEGRGEDEPLFLNSKGSPITSSYMTKTIWKLRQQYPELGNFHQYQCRHQAGTNARRLAGLEGAQAFLGHESATTSEIYSEVDSDLARQIAENIG